MLAAIGVSYRAQMDLWSQTIVNKPAVTESIQTVIVSKADMMRFHDPERILSYCQSCDKHGMFWSCPPFEGVPLDQLPEWSHALLVTQKTPVNVGSTKEELITQFLAARQILGDRMKLWETTGTITVIAGHCSGCTVCNRTEGIDCCFPSKMRYSLEALGFDVTGLAEGLAGQTVHWPESGIPDYLMTVGALLCPNFDLAMSLGK